MNGPTAIESNEVVIDDVAAFCRLYEGDDLVVSLLLEAARKSGRLSIQLFD